MSSLKDALLKAGLKTAKVENERKAKYKKDITKTEKHQYNRNYCEQCHGTYPDVEKFNHRNYSVDAQWMCVNCADLAEIHDECRATNQSEFARTRRYIRRYGPTKVFPGEADMRKAPKGARAPRKETKKREPKYTLDDDGEKNFNC